MLARKYLNALVLTLVTFQVLPKSTAAPMDDEEDSMHPDLRLDSLYKKILKDEDLNSFWHARGKDFIRKQARAEPNSKKAKNIILFLGDGMGLTTLAAARNLLGGEEFQLSFEKFPYTGLSKTYSVDKIVPDSACTSTAYLCGIKANYGTIGVNAQVARGDCDAMRNTSNHVFSIGKWAMDAGKAAGLVTTTRVTHASPSGMYANTADREWENEVIVKKFCGSDTDLPDIAQQLINGEVGSKLKVMLGGGKAQFLDAKIYAGGYRQDERNLIEEYQKKSSKYAYVETKEDLFKLNLIETERLLGLFHNTHMDYHLDAVQNEQNTQPSLEEMTRKAIEFMQSEEDGYFLFIEGGKIDLGHHGVMPRIALDETIEFSKAIDLARNMTSENDTLIVVTSDHSHTFSLAGYQARGSDIFDVTPKMAEDKKPYLSLSYANGDSFDSYYNTNKHSRRNPVNQLNNGEHDKFPATVPLSSETHGGEDVAVFASGPWAHLFTGVYEQNTIPHLMAYAACIGNGLKAC